MNGYFILEDQAKKLGLIDDPQYSFALQKTIIAITENDVNEFNENSKLTVKNVKDIQIWFYQNYYDVFMENINDNFN